jgi:hypothetical protein
VLTNPDSRRNRRHAEAVRDLVAGYPAVVYREGRDGQELDSSVRAMLADGVEVLAVNGGDGTVQSVLSTLFADATVERVPELVLLRGGTTNMNADDVGPRGSLVPALRRTLAMAQSDPVAVARCRRPILRVAANGGALLKHGMFFGAGAIVNGIEYCHRSVHSRGFKDGLAPAICTLRVLYAMARGDQTLAAPVSMHISPSPRPEWLCEGDWEAQQLVVLATTLERLFLGLRPYWGPAHGPVHFTALRARPARPWRVMPPLFWGRPGPLATPGNGYASGGFDAVEIEMEGAITLDGEIYPVTRSAGPVQVSVGGWATFLTP